MIVAIIVCTAWAAGPPPECVRMDVYSKAFQTWSAANCLDLVPESIRPHTIWCGKVHEGVSS